MTITDAHPTNPDVPGAVPTVPSPAPAAPRRRGRRVAGTVLGLAGLATLAAGAFGGWAMAQRDDGWFTSDPHRFEAPGRAITSDELDFGTGDGADGDADLGRLFRVRLEATTDGSGPAPFVGIGRTADVEAYLAGVAHSVVTDVDTDPFRAEYRTIAGDGVPGPPAAETFWATTNAGAGAVEWEPDGGDWTAVVMHADGHAGVRADVEAGFEIRHLGWFVAGVLGLGAVLTASGTVLAVWSRARPTAGR